MKLKKPFGQSALFFVLPILIMLIIFLFSAQKAPDSSKISKGITSGVFAVIELFHPIPHTIQKETAFLSVEGVIRKIAHFILYFIFGGALAFALSRTRFSKKTIVIIISALSLFFAASDEYHQLLVPGRSGQVTDVFLDFGSALVGMCIFYLLVRKIKKQQSKKQD